MLTSEKVAPERELRFVVDRRLGGYPRYRITREDDLMQVPDEIRKCAVFVCCRGEGGNIGFMGTAFAISVDTLRVGLSFVYLVTAKHVISAIHANSKDDKVLLRVNSRAGGSTFIESDVADWWSHPDDDSVDAAVLAVSLPFDTLDLRSIPSEMIATQEVIAKEHIGVGDEVFITGLFVNHYGQERNLPIVRTGNIALMPEEKVYAGPTFGPMDAYLVEARSIGGLSGSPAFVHLGIYRIDEAGQWTMNTAGWKYVYWLGLVHGHWDAQLGKNEDYALATEAVNMGIAMIVPGEKILEVMNQEGIVKQRNQQIAALAAAQAPTQDSVSQDFSKRDFADALKKVSRRKKPSESEPSS